MGDRFFDRPQILLDYFFAFVAISTADGFANCLNRFLTWQHFGHREEVHLQDDIHARSQPGITRHLVTIDNEELCLFLDKLLLYLARQTIPDFLGAKWAVQQEDSAFDQSAEHVIALEEDPLMASN